MADEDIRDAAHAGRERRHDKPMPWAMEAAQTTYSQGESDEEYALAIQRAAEPLLASGDKMASCLEEWCGTKFFDNEEEWRKWATDLRGRVEEALQEWANAQQ